MDDNFRISLPYTYNCNVMLCSIKCYSFQFYHGCLGNSISRRSTIILKYFNQRIKLCRNIYWLGAKFISCPKLNLLVVWSKHDAGLKFYYWAKNQKYTGTLYGKVHFLDLTCKFSFLEEIKTPSCCPRLVLWWYEDKFGIVNRKNAI